MHRHAAAVTPAVYLAMNPALFIRPMCVASAAATQSAYALPSSEVVSNAPFSIRSFHSCVACTLVNRST